MYSTVMEFITDWKREAMLTQKVFDTLTDTSLEQQVSQEGRTLGRIAWHIAINIPEFLLHFGVQIEKVQNAETVPLTAVDIKEAFRKVSIEVTESVMAQWTNESLKHVQDAFGRSLPNAAILSLLIKHMIHHRGQMTVLMRQAGLRVPGVYGPAKEEWIQIGMEAPRI